MDRRPLGVICGAGELPGVVAAAADAGAWEAVAITFDGEPAPAAARRELPASLSAPEALLTALARAGVRDVVLAGSFAARPWLAGARIPGDALARSLLEASGALEADALGARLIAVLAGRGVTVRDQREFLGGLTARPGVWTRRGLSPQEADDARRGFAVARRLGELHVGQTVVVKRGAVIAVEGVEGTTAALTRAGLLAGPGAVAAKAAWHGHDYRFDAPTIGPETLVAAARAGLAALAVEAGRIFVLDADECVRLADHAGIALVGDDGAP